MSERVTDLAGIVDILGAIADINQDQLATAADTAVADAGARSLAVELTSALYGASDVIAVKRAIEDAVAPLELGGHAAGHLEVLAGDAAFAALLTAQDAGQEVAGALTAPWHAVVGG